MVRTRVLMGRVGEVEGRPDVHTTDVGMTEHPVGEPGLVEHAVGIQR